MNHPEILKFLVNSKKSGDKLIAQADKLPQNGWVIENPHLKCIFWNDEHNGWGGLPWATVYDKPFDAPLITMEKDAAVCDPMTMAEAKAKVQTHAYDALFTLLDMVDENDDEKAAA